MAICYRASVTLTDLPEFVPLLNLNIETNTALLKGKTTAQALKWGSTVADVNLHSPDFILIADCVYYEEVIQQISSYHDRLHIVQMILDIVTYKCACSYSILCSMIRPWLTW